MNNTIFKQIFLNKSGYCFNPKYSYSKLFKLKEYRHNSIINNIIRNIIIFINSIYIKLKNNMRKVVVTDVKINSLWYGENIKIFQYG